MSTTTLQIPDPLGPSTLQIWNNAAFDDAGGLVPKSPWLPLQPLPTNRPERLDLDSSKENRTPIFPKSKKPPPTADADIDAEIEQIEAEIGRLSARLDALRVKKAVQAAARRGRVVPAKFMEPKQDLETPDGKKIRESPGSVRFPQTGAVGSAKKNLEALAALKKIVESPASARIRRRRASLGPMEIHNCIGGSAGDAPPGGTPFRSVLQSRQRSSFLKLEDIQEDKVSGLSFGAKSSPSIAKAPEPSRGVAAGERSMKPAVSPATNTVSSARIRRRGVSLGPAEIAASTRPRCKIPETKGKGTVEERSRSSSSSPKSRSRSAAKFSDLRKGIATVCGSKSVQREEEQSKILKPKVLFQDARSSVPSKKPAKSMKARVVASRYSLAPARISGDEPRSNKRKWSLPDPGKEEEEDCRADNKRPLSLGDSSSNQGSQSSPLSIARIAQLLPSIRTTRHSPDTPRDSGCVKRAADMVGKKSYFGAAEDENVTSPREALNFEEEEEEARESIFSGSPISFMAMN